MPGNKILWYHIYLTLLIFNVLQVKAMESVCIGPWGATTEGTSFDYQPKGRIRSILIHHGVVIDGIRFLSDEKSDDNVTRTFGGPGGSMDLIFIRTATEYLTGLDLNYGMFDGEMIITSLIFYTNKKMHGPYGGGAGTATSFPIKDGSILGFHGRAGKYINAIGVYAKPNNSLVPDNKVKVMESLCVGPWGATREGQPFDYQPKGHITVIHVRHEGVVNWFKFQSNGIGENKLEPTFGGPGGGFTDKICIDAPGEYLTGLEFSYKIYDGEKTISLLKFHTNKKIHGPYGQGPGMHSTFFPIKDGCIVGFHGRAGKYINAIGIYAKANSSLLPVPEDIDDGIISVPREVGLWGSQEGRPWDNGVYLSVQKVFVQVEHISSSDTILRSIRFMYEKKDGCFVWSPLYGTMGNEQSTQQAVIDCSSETLIGVDGFYGSGHPHITSLTFHTNKKKYGPFGIEIGTFFSTNLYPGKIVGFFGRSGQYLNAIGVHTDYN